MTTPPELIYRGPNADLVNEVLDFSFSSRIVAEGAIALHRNEQYCVESLPDAVDLAGGFGSHWQEMKSSRVAQLIQTEAWFAWRDEHDRELRKCDRLATRWDAESPMWLHDHLRNRLPEGPAGPDGSAGYYRAYVVNEISCDMMECCKNRAFNGPAENFWETLFQAYQTGGWPCSNASKRISLHGFKIWFH